MKSLTDHCKYMKNLVFAFSFHMDWNLARDLKNSMKDCC